MREHVRRGYMRRTAVNARAMNLIPIQLLLVTGFVLLHLFAGRLRFLHVVPRSRWLSAAGGASVAYVFLHLFPELQSAQTQLAARVEDYYLVEHVAYLLALGGLVTFYGLERTARRSQQRQATANRASERVPPSAAVFWLHIASFGIYNMIVGYLLARGEDQSVRQLLYFFVAMALHFLVTDYGLREDHQHRYQTSARWLLAAAIVTGWVIGLQHEGSRTAAHLLFAVIAGAVVLNVMKEELPKERESSLGAFVAGAASYAALLLLA